MKSSPRQRRIRPLKAKAATADAEFESYGAEPNMKLSHAFMVVLALHVIAVGGLFAFNKVKAGHSKVSQKLQTEIAAGQEAVIKEEAKPLVSASVHEAAHEAVHEVEKEIPKKEIPKVTEASMPVSAPVVTKIKEPVVPPAPAKKIAPAPTAPALTATQKAFLATKTSASSATLPVASSSGAVAAVANMASSTAAPASESVSETVPEASAAAMEYTIVKGDNPYKIAKRFHVPYDQLIKFNNITDPRKMQIGQKIRIPKKSNG